MGTLSSRKAAKVSSAILLSPQFAASAPDPFSDSHCGGPMSGYTRHIKVTVKLANGIVEKKDGKRPKNRKLNLHQCQERESSVVPKSTARRTACLLAMG